MARYLLFTAWIGLTLTEPLAGQPPVGKEEQVSRALAVQQAMNNARDRLRDGKPAEAVAVLEAEILNVNGNATYLALMKEAYVAYLGELKRTPDAAARIDHVVRQLKILDPKFDPSTVAAAETPKQPAGSKPMPAVDEPKPAVEEPPSQIVTPAPRANPKPKLDDDPFAQVPLDRQPKGDPLARAAAAFNAKRYSEAANLFAEANRQRKQLSESEQQAWAYSRLHLVVTQLNQGEQSAAALAQLKREVEDASRIGGKSLESFARTALTEINKRQGANPETAKTSTIPEGWQALEAGSFRVFYQTSRLQAEEVAKRAEQVRTATYEKWSGPAGGDWSPRCDVWLHATGADYAKATQKPADSPGHASVGIQAGKVAARRIDLRIDESSMLEMTLPREVAYVVVADLFAEQPLPRWADVGICTLAGSEADVARYRRAAPRMIEEKRHFALQELLKMPEFPDAARITPFYVESVTLVEYLVRLKGPKAFALYLREAPRRGYEEALQRHYGFKNAAELQEGWQKFVAAGE